MLFDWLRLDELLETPGFADHSRESLSAIFDLCAGLAEKTFLPSYKLADQKEPWIENGVVQVVDGIREAMEKYAEMGLISASFDAEDGGAQLPFTAYMAVMAHFMSANASAMSVPLLTTANARLLLKFGTPAQIDAFAAPQIEGRFSGTMCISETQAGSSVGDSATRAFPDGVSALGRQYRLCGSKMWISGGDQNFSENIVHLVLAKVAGADGSLAAGSRGLSLFIVPKFVEGPNGPERNDMFATGLNHKMGYRGIPNCVMTLGDGLATPFGMAGAVGYLVAEEGQGIAIMFHMMNEARVAIGLGAAMLGYRGYQLSLAYANERLQGRLEVDGRPSGKSVAIIRHPDVRRMLLSQKSWCEGALALILYTSLQVDRASAAATAGERAAAQAIVELLTPIAKTWPSEWGLAANDLAIQIHGGYGYTRDFDVEQLYRDNRLNPIHEGTTGIQAKDFVQRKTMRDRGKAFQLLGTRVTDTIGHARRDVELTGLADDLHDAWQRLDVVVKEILSGDLADAARMNEVPLLGAAGHIVVAWLWLDMALVARSKLDTAVAKGKLFACRHFFHQELPKAHAMLESVIRGADAHMRIPDEAF